MEFEPLRAFLSAENISAHKAYLAELKLRYSVLCKSVAGLKDMSLPTIWRSLPRGDIKDEAMRLSSEIAAHEIYFCSFSNKRHRSAAVRKKYGTEDTFLYELFRSAKGARSGFLYVYADLHYDICSDGGFYFKGELPVLAVDLFEHAYFSDYSFDIKRYLEAATAHLDLSKIAENVKKDCKSDKNMIK